MFERLSLADQSLISSYAEHIQRYEFALAYCRGKRVLDAGCGIGYGSHFLAANGATSVVAVDISDAALAEARENYRSATLRFEKLNVEEIGAAENEVGSIDVVINFENIEHLNAPEAFLAGSRRLLPQSDGILVTSTPNGAISDLDENGRLRNRFHVKEFTRAEFSELLGKHFGKIELYGQWLTHNGKLRQLRSRELFEQLCEAYYNPIMRLGRAIKTMLGKPVAGPPQFTAAADHYSGDCVIAPLGDAPFRWEPTVLIAVCR